MENEFLPIRYGGFWDVPSSFITEYKNELYFFERDDFDEDLDDYPPNYKVYRIPNMKFEDAFVPREDHPRAVLFLPFEKSRDGFSLERFLREA